MRATGASAASLDIQPDTSGETSISEYKKTLKPDITNEHVLHTFKLISRMSLVPDSRSVPRRQPVPVPLRLTLDPTHPVTRLYQTQGRTSIKGKQKTGVHTPVRIKFSPSVRVPPTGVPRRCCNAGYSAQHHGQDQYNHSHKNPSRENHVFVPK